MTASSLEHFLLSLMSSDQILTDTLPENPQSFKSKHWPPAKCSSSGEEEVRCQLGGLDLIQSQEAPRGIQRDPEARKISSFSSSSPVFTASLKGDEAGAGCRCWREKSTP